VYRIKCLYVQNFPNFGTILSTNKSRVAPDLILSLAKDLENAVFGNYKGKIDPMYKRRIQTLFLNLKNKANPNLRARVISGDISTARLATMDTKEMASEEMKKENERLQQENLRESMVAKAEKSISDQLQCGKCGKKRVSYTQAQTRSADEPMTTFCTCENCGHMWKVCNFCTILRYCGLLTRKISFPSRKKSIQSASENRFGVG
jgi:transcription elongation factor S-II